MERAHDSAEKQQKPRLAYEPPAVEETADFEALAQPCNPDFPGECNWPSGNS